MRKSVIKSQPDAPQIQIVDDNPENLALLSALLAQQGYEVRVSTSGKLAIKSVLKNPPDLILLNIVLPDLDGYQVCEQLKADERSRIIPVLFVVPLEDLLDKEKVFDMSGVDYVTVPFHEKEILTRVKSHLALRQAQQLNETKNIHLKSESESPPLAGVGKRAHSLFLQDVINSLPHPFYIIETDTYQVQIANSAAYEGKLRDDLTCFGLIHGRKIPCEGDEFSCPLIEIKHTKKPAVMEHTHLDSDGGSRHVEVHGFPIFDVDGNLIQMIEYTLDITERKRAEDARLALTHALDERVKELTCLYQISRLIDAPGISLTEILQGTTELIPSSWQYPQITCARIIMGGDEYKTVNFEDSPWKLGADIKQYGAPTGEVQVHYLEDMPEVDEGPFLKEERLLIDAIAELLGKTTERLQAEERVIQNEIHLAAIQERERIGRDLHDDLGQVMAYVKVQAQAAQVRLKSGQTEQTAAILDQLVQVAKGAHTKVREYILGVRTTDAEPSDDFFAALNAYLKALNENYALDVQVSLPEDWLESPLAPEVETQLLRIIQEALTNVQVHAGVDRARLLFTQHGDDVQVIIEDDGAGFDGRQFAEGLDEGRHFGLNIMRERAESVCGEIEVRSAPGSGTAVIVRMPVSLAPISQDGLDKSIRVLLVDDHPLYLEGLHSLLAARGLSVVGQAHDGLQALEQARLLLPDLILMDVQMPLCDGIEATRRIKAELPETKIVILTMNADRTTLLEALKSGASGYLLKDLDGDKFFSMLAEVLKGNLTLSPALTSMAVGEFAQEVDLSIDANSAPKLTMRQEETLKLVAEGLSNKDIASRLNISQATVKFHVGQILERLKLNSRHQLAQYAQERGIIVPGEDGSYR